MTEVKKNNLTTLKGDRNSKVLSISLDDILEQIEDGACFSWKILWIDAISKISDDFNIKDFKSKVDKNEDGLKIDFDELKKLNDKLHQLLELLLVGYPKENEVCKNISDNELKEKSVFFIELVDGAYWEVSSKDNKFEMKLLKHFNE